MGRITDAQKAAVVARWTSAEKPAVGGAPMATKVTL